MVAVSFSCTKNDSTNPTTTATPPPELATYNSLTYTDIYEIHQWFLDSTVIDTTKQAAYTIGLLALEEHISLDTSDVSVLLSAIGWSRSDFVNHSGEFDPDIYSIAGDSTSPTVKNYLLDIEDIVDLEYYEDVIVSFEDLEIVIDSDTALSPVEEAFLLSICTIGRSSADYWFGGATKVAGKIKIGPGERAMLKGDVKGAVGGALRGGFTGAFLGAGVGAVPGAVLGGMFGGAMGSAVAGIEWYFGW